MILGSTWKKWMFASLSNTSCCYLAGVFWMSQTEPSIWYPWGSFIQNDVNNYSQHLVLLPSLIMSSWNLPLQWARIFTFTLEELILYLKMSKSISPRRAIGQVQKFVGRRIIISLEVTVRESIHVFSHSLILIHISCYIINLSTSMLPFSSHFTSGQS